MFQQKERLIGVGNLFKNAWSVYVNRFFILAGIAIIPGVFYFLSQAVSEFSGSQTNSNLLIQLAVFLLAVGGLLINTLANSALVFAVANKDEVGFGIKKSFAVGWNNYILYIWVSSLAGIFIFSGFFLFIIPGIIFFVWFAFSLFVFAMEGAKGIKAENRIRGMNALFRSKQLTEGYWWKIFWRLAVLFISLFVAMFFVDFISKEANISYLPNIFNIFATPFILVYNFLIYNNLKEIKKDVLFIPVARKTKTKFILICFAGILVAIIIISAIVVLSYNPSILWRLIT